VTAQHVRVASVSTAALTIVSVVTTVANVVMRKIVHAPMMIAAHVSIVKPLHQQVITTASKNAQRSVIVMIMLQNALSVVVTSVTTRPAVVTKITADRQVVDTKNPAAMRDFFIRKILILVTH